jgi:hypothetical protein
LVSSGGMTTIEIESPRDDADLGARVQKSLEVLRQANRSLEIKGLVQVLDADAERAVNVLLAANIRASIRPS